jgi:hypothetical protein
MTPEGLVSNQTSQAILYEALVPYALRTLLDNKPPHPICKFTCVLKSYFLNISYIFSVKN